MYRRFHIIFASLLLLVAQLGAQPQLPNVAGASEKGVVLLSWVCQYDHVKTIAVRRSREAGYNYKIIGYVKNVSKGQQAFADGHPEPGKNYYKLNIVFSSGLEWGSNYCEVDVDTAVLESRTLTIPSNDTLQKYLDITGAAVRPLVGFTKDSTRLKGGSEVSVSFDSRGVIAGEVADEVEAEIRRSRIRLVLPKEQLSEPTFIRSRFVTVMNATGHIGVKLPSGYSEHKYAVTFYNELGRVRVDIPALTEPIVIIDKRNFQKRGLYRFVLKQDGIVFEAGYVSVVP